MTLVKHYDGDPAHVTYNHWYLEVASERKTAYAIDKMTNYYLLQFKHIAIT